MFGKIFLLGIEARHKTEPDINAYFRLPGYFRSACTNQHFRKRFLIRFNVSGVSASG
jgi:hypothetical protein